MPLSADSTESPTPSPSPRLYCPTLDVPGPWPRECRLDRAQSRHGRTVLRLSVGAGVELFDGQGRVGIGCIERLESGVMVCRVERCEHFQASEPRIIIASALPKGSRSDAMVDQLSQVGADRLILLRSERGVVAPRPGKVQKLRRRAIESAKQCRRAWVMQIDEPTDLAAVLCEPSVVGLILQPGPVVGSAVVPPPAWPSAGQLLALVGPEGGWSQAELAQAQAAGFSPWSVGPHVMRIETAAVVAAALLRMGKKGPRGQGPRGQ